jgi:hypothetical protein
VGFRGGVQFAVIRQFADDGDKGFEVDNGPNGVDASSTLEPRSRPHYANVTWLGQHTAASQHGVSIGFRSGTGISVWNTTMQNSRKTELQSEKANGTTGTCNFSGPTGNDVLLLHNLWIFEPTVNEVGDNFASTSAGDTATDKACLQSLFASDASNQQADPMIDLTSGFPNHVP